jgi:hypothetical protein
MGWTWIPADNGWSRKVRSQPSWSGAPDRAKGQKKPKARKWAPYAVCKSGCTPECATSFMDVSRILSGKQPTCKFCNTAWDPTQYPLCQAIKDKKEKDSSQGNPPGNSAANAAKAPANAGAPGDGPRIGSGFTTPPQIPPEMDWIEQDMVNTLHSLYHANSGVQDPARWEGLKTSLTGITDPTKLGQLDFIIQKPAMAPKQAMHQSTVWLQTVRAKKNRCDHLRITTKAALDKHKLHAMEVRAKLQQEEDRLAEEATDAMSNALNAQKELEEAQATYDKEMEQMVTPPTAPIDEDPEDEVMPSAQDLENQAKVTKELEAKATALAMDMCKKGISNPEDIKMDEDGKRSLTECVELCHKTLRRVPTSGPRAAKIARTAIAPEVAAVLQKQADEAKTGM